MHQLENKNIINLKKGAVVAFLLKALSVMVLLLLNIKLGRMFGPKGIGVFNFGITVATLTGIIVTLGLPPALIRLIPEYVTQKKWSQLKGLLIRSHQIVLVSSLLASVFLWIVSCFLVAETLILSLRFASFLLVLISLSRLRRFTFQGFQNIAASIIPTDILLPSFFIVGLVILNSNDLIEIFILYIFLSVVIFLGVTFFLFRSVQKEIILSSPVYLTSKWLRIAFPMMLGGMSQVVMNRMDIVMLGSMSDMETVGLYTISNKIAGLNIFVLGAINAMAAPLLSNLYHSGKLTQFQAMIRKSMVWSGLGALPIFLAILFAPGFLLSFFGTEFSKGYEMLILLGCGQFVNALSGPVGFALVVSGQEKIFARISGFIAVGNLIGNFLLIPIWGGLGAAGVTAVSVILLNSIMFYQVKKTIN